MNRLARTAAYLAVVAMFAFGMWLTDYRFDQAVDRVEAEATTRAEDQCVAGAETRRILRQMSYDVGVASGVAGGEALIQTVGDAEEATIAAYRANLVDQLDPALTQIIERLPDRRWVDGECVDVPVEE
jgi:hypothetical protein